MNIPSITYLQKFFPIFFFLVQHECIITLMLCSRFMWCAPLLFLLSLPLPLPSSISLPFPPPLRPFPMLYLFFLHCPSHPLKLTSFTIANFSFFLFSPSYLFSSFFLFSALLCNVCHPLEIVQLTFNVSFFPLLFLFFLIFSFFLFSFLMKYLFFNSLFIVL